MSRSSAGLSRNWLCIWWVVDEAVRAEPLLPSRIDCFPQESNGLGPQSGSGANQFLTLGRICCILCDNPQVTRLGGCRCTGSQESARYVCYGPDEIGNRL